MINTLKRLGNQTQGVHDQWFVKSATLKAISYPFFLVLKVELISNILETMPKKYWTNGHQKVDAHHKMAELLLELSSLLESFIRFAKQHSVAAGKKSLATSYVYSNVFKDHGQPG